MNGGYILIDCKGLELTSESTQTIDGLFDRIADAVATGKPVYACNVLFATAPMSPVPVMICLNANGSYVCTASTLQIWVNDDDEVTIVNLAPAD